MCYHIHMFGKVALTRSSLLAGAKYLLVRLLVLAFAAAIVGLGRRRSVAGACPKADERSSLEKAGHPERPRPLAAQQSPKRTSLLDRAVKLVAVLLVLFVVINGQPVPEPDAARSGLAYFAPELTQAITFLQIEELGRVEVPVARSPAATAGIFAPGAMDDPIGREEAAVIAVPNDEPSVEEELSSSALLPAPSETPIPNPAAALDESQAESTEVAATSTPSPTMEPGFARKETADVVPQAPSTPTNQAGYPTSGAQALGYNPYPAPANPAPGWPGQGTPGGQPPTPGPSGAPTPAATPAPAAGPLLSGGAVGSPQAVVTTQTFQINLPLVQFGSSITPTIPTYRVYVPFLEGGAQRTTTPTATPTPTPSPTLTPTPISTPGSPYAIVQAIQQMPPRSTNKQSKIGVGVYADGGGYPLNELLKLRPGLVILMDPKPEFAMQVRQQLPKAFIIGRRFAASQPLDNPEVRGAAFADHVAQMAVPLRGIVDGWMSYNEPVGHGDIAGYQAYNAFQVAFAKRLQGTYGIGAVAGNDPPGAVDIEDYPRYFGEAIRISKFFGIHAYSSPEGTSLQEPEALWYGLRYRKIHQALEAAGIKSGPIIITELGVAKGWRAMGLNYEQVAADFAWYADETAKDDYLLGFAIFGIFPASGWQPFDLGGTTVLDLMGRYDPTSPPRMAPTPTRIPGLNR
ncbi:MAG: hypothetical protein M1358_06220 [Chloroflexi bacterium]|nr:hypothetical protein [Chloroflexota bacterium]